MNPTPELKGPDALQSFIGRKTEIDELLDALKTLSDAHFHIDPDQVNWGHVGDQNYWIAQLQEIARFAGLVVDPES